MKQQRDRKNAEQRELEQVLDHVRGCTVCANSLPFPPKPVLSVSATTRILIIGQAPGQKVHQLGIPWQDKSGDALCSWMGINRDELLDNRLIGTMPMGFCFPGSKERGGDLPPRPECAPLWHQAILQHLRDVQLTLFI